VWISVSAILYLISGIDRLNKPSVLCFVFVFLCSQTKRNNFLMRWSKNFQVKMQTSVAHFCCFAGGVTEDPLGISHRTDYLAHFLALDAVTGSSPQR